MQPLLLRETFISCLTTVISESTVEIMLIIFLEPLYDDFSEISYIKNLYLETFFPHCC